MTLMLVWHFTNLFKLSGQTRRPRTRVGFEPTSPDPLSFSQECDTHPQNCYHSICPYVLVSGVVCISTSTSLLNGRAVRLACNALGTRFGDCGSSPSAASDGIGTRFSFTARRLSSPIFKVAGFLLHYAILGIFIAPFILCIALTDALRILKSGAPALGSDLICAICNRFNDARSHAGGLSAEFPHNSRRGTSLFGAGRDTHRLVMLTGLEPILRD